MKSDHNNPFDGLAELELNSGSKGDLFEETEIFAELRIDEDEIEVEGFFATVGISKANLELELWGCDILPGTRLNDQSRSALVGRLTREMHTEGNKGFSLGGTLTPNSGQAKLDGNIGRSSKKKMHVEYDHEWATEFVSCRPGKRWLIADPTDVDKSGLLSGTFISNEKLCSIMARPDSNLVEVCGRLTIRRRDLVVNPEGNVVERELRKRTHQEKFVKAVLARSIVRNSDQEGSESQTGKIVVSMSRLSGEDDSGT